MNEWITRKNFLLLTEEEEGALKSLEPLMTRHVDELVTAFYRHLLRFAETRRLLSDELIATRLKDAQKRYLLSLVTGPHDERYRDDRLRIGQVHDRIGLTPRWYLGAYSLYLNLLRPLIFEEFRNRPGQFQIVVAALTKVIFLDIGLAIDAYILQSSERLEFANRQLAELGRDLEKGLTGKKKDLERAQEQLQQTERLAELATLASGMAHEIGTPMSVILGRAEYLMNRTDDEATKKGLGTIVAQVERVTKVMNQLLAIARRRPAERRAVNLKHTIEENLEMFRERLARHRIQVELDFADPVRPVSADADQMSQVFLNLIMNAIHAMPDGGTLRAEGTQVNDNLRISLTDTGHGIPAEHLSRVFDPFFTTKETGKGTGLGLTVVKGIIEEHGGTITVESEPGRGTTFTITLPVEAGHEPRAARGSSRAL